MNTRMISVLFFLFVVGLQSVKSENIATEKDSLPVKFESRFAGNPSSGIFRYKSNILIQIKGDVSRSDSLLFQELKEKLSGNVGKWDVDIVPQSGNIVFNISSDLIYLTNTVEQRKSSEIVQTVINISVPVSTSVEARKKIYYFYLMRSLGVLKGNLDDHSKIEGCVFDESFPEKVTFNPIDIQMINRLYAGDLKPNNQTVESQGAGKSQFAKNSRISLSASILGFIFSASFLFVLLGIFKDKKNNYLWFLIRSLIVFCAFLIYFSSQIFSLYLTRGRDLFLHGKSLEFVGVVLLILFFFTIAASVIYHLENFLIARFNIVFIKVVAPLALTILVPELFAVVVIVVVGKLDAMVTTTILGAIMFYSAFVSLIRAFYIFLEIKSQNIISKKDVELSRLNALNKQIELQSLQSKINPHFLYNALNSIAILTRYDAGKSEKMALALSDFFKYSLNKEQKEMVPIREELKSVETYLEIEKVRFGDRLNYELICQEDLIDSQIPQFLIQPVIENAVKHGVSKNSGSGLVRLEIRTDENRLEISVFDSGPDFPDEPISGYGIQSIQDKLNLIYGEKAYLRWGNIPHKRLIIILPTPINK